MADGAVDRHVRRRASLRDVAAQAGVSVASASNVLNFRRSRDDGIGLAVLAAARELGYRADAMAANLRRATSRLVGVILPDFENTYFGTLLSALEHEANISGYRLTVATSRDDAAIERREIGALLDWRVAGFLVAPTVRGLPDGLKAAGVPFVVVDRVSGDPGTDEVGAENEGACRDVAERLVALGHRRILVAHSDPLVLNMAERLRGVERAVGEGAAVTLERLACGWTIESANAAFERRLTEGPLPSAIIALNNLTCLAAWGAAVRRGLVPGRDLALVGFDDVAWMEQVTPPVAAIEQPVTEIATIAWTRLMARIDGDDVAATSTRISCCLKARGTIIPP